MSEQKNSLSDLHSQFNTPEEKIFQLVQESTSHVPTKKTKVMKGYENEVYEVETQENHSYIVRIKRDSESNFESEAWAMQQCTEKGIPVPAVLAVGNIAVESGLTEYMVIGKVTGQPFGEIKEKLTAEQVSAVWVKVGEILRQLHTITVSGFYKWHPQSQWDFSTWEKFQNSNIADRSQESPWLLQAGFTEQDIQKMIHFLEMYRDEFTCDQPVLCHGDLLQEHVFVDDQLNLTGIIDFGMMQGNHPIHDFSRLYMDSRFRYLEELKKGYGASDLFDDSFEQRLLLHTLGLQIGNLAYYMQRKMGPETEWSKNRLLETFTLLDTK